jgi:quercetin dioxygenase-like cupin family protein
VTIVPLEIHLNEGPEREIAVRFSGQRRKLIQITLRAGAVLAGHKAPDPITIHCLAGTGTLRGEDGTAIALMPGTLVTLEPNEWHEVWGEPAVSLLVTRFVL